MLAVVDVSGSMAELVPGTGLTRLELTIRAASAGLSLLPAGSAAGLWEFSTDLAPGTDYRELVTIGEVTGGHATALVKRLARLRPIPNGSTGLYDTVLAAVRRVRSGYDPTRTNAVVLLTDGANQDPHGLRLAGLLDRLRARAGLLEASTGDLGRIRPRQRCRVTPSDKRRHRWCDVRRSHPRRIRSVLLDAIGQRLCRPDCVPVG